MTSAEADDVASAEVSPTKMASTEAPHMASAEVSPTNVASTKAPHTSAEVSPTNVASTKAASAKPSAMAAPHAAASEVASPTTLAKRHRATRYRESAGGDTGQQRDDGTA